MVIILFVGTISLFINGGFTPMHKKKTIRCFALAMVLVFLAGSFAFAGTDDILRRWQKERTFKNDLGSDLTIKVTYFSTEYIEALVNSEAEKNLWTADEMENYKYELLKTLRLDEYIPIHVDIDNRGPSMHMAPFDRQITLWLDGDQYSPADYDKRFNFKLTEKRDGFVFFPRFDEKTGKSLLEGVKRAKVNIKGSISSTTDGIPYIDYLWDIYNDDPTRLYSGKAAAQLEIDRLIKRLEKLMAEKNKLEAQLSEVQSEVDMVNQRIEELRKQ